MGTRSTIAIRNTNNTVTGIYCHWDGYLEHNGRILNQHYSTEEQVRELIALGNLSQLGEQIGDKHPFSRHEVKPDEVYEEEKYMGWCTAYERDRGEKGQQAVTRATWEIFRYNNGQEYNYIFEPKDQRWYVNQDDNAFFESLDDALSAIEETDEA